jgi:hypothetical protein
LSEVKVAFDLTSGDGKALLTQLNVIDEMRQSLMNQGVKPHFVLTFRGPATKLVQTDQSQIKAQDREHAAKIAGKSAQTLLGRRDQELRTMCGCRPSRWQRNQRTSLQGSRWSGTAGSRLLAIRPRDLATFRPKKVEDAVYS